mgnify:CR=1 FL=1
MSDVYYPSAPSIHICRSEATAFPKEVVPVPVVEMLYILPVSPGLKLRTSSFVQAVHNRAVGNEGGGGVLQDFGRYFYARIS